ncbi:MAG TPA: TonB-dependent receptor [Allosphingosinicella sp.]|jgi:vitamin B12 transporter
MSLFVVSLLSGAPAAAAPVSAPAGEAIVVTASLRPVEAAEAPVSASVLERETVEALALPLAADALRLLPGASVAQSGPRGSQTQLRIRGAEANHTLLFVDGIRFNDPAAGNEARFELLTADALSRVELVRGPQSALWGSEALGGVVAVDTADPLHDRGVSALGEYGGLHSVRLAGSGAVRSGGFGLSGSAGWLRSDGIDSLGGGGERDGFRNGHASLKAAYEVREGVRIGAVGHWVEGNSEFDGYDPATFQRADTLDETRNRMGAVRGWGEAALGDWEVRGGVSYLASSNRNRVGAAPLNRTAGERLTVTGQVSRMFGGHSFTAAAEHQAEDFRARDQVYLGGTDQDRSRSLTALVGEWHAEWAPIFSTDVAVRHDSFSAYADATTFRAAALLRPAAGWRVHGAYGEGIAQPTFYDLYGFFPGSFVGNPALKPESSRGWEAGVRWESGAFGAGATLFLNPLKDEIVETPFDPATFTSSVVNAPAKSRRRGVELDASWRPSSAVLIAANYTFLSAEERQAVGAALVREGRRPKHSANLLATGRHGRFSWGASAAWVGERADTNFDVLPSQRVTLDDYVLASLRVGWEVVKGVEAFARAENAFDADYQDAVNYATAGRTVHAGLRIRFSD